MHIPAARGINANQPRQVKHLANSVRDFVALLSQRDPRMAGRGLTPQRIRRLRTWPRCQLRDQVVGKLAELLMIGNRRRFTLQLDHPTHAGIDAAEERDPAGLGRPTKACCHGLLALFAQVSDGRRLVAVSLLQGPFALHHGQLRLVTQVFDRCGGDLRHEERLLSCSHATPAAP